MDATAKLLLDEMKKMSDHFVSRFNVIDKRLKSLELRDKATRNRIKPLEEKAAEVTVWQQEVDSAVSDLAVKLDSVEQLVSKADNVDGLKQQISILSNKIDRVVLDRGGSAQGILPKPETAAATPLAGHPVIGPTGHRFDSNIRENGFGSIMAYTQLPVKGMIVDPQFPSTFDSRQFSSHRSQSFGGTAVINTNGRWPKPPFPEFDGDNPKLWQSRCENYFDMSGVDKTNWVRIASMYFEGLAARWLQSVERRANTVGWDVFCKMVLERFGRDQHELFIRQLFHIKKTGSVQEYVEQFVQLVDNLSAYASTTDPLYYTMRFIDGLKDEIKPIVLVQRPQDLDTACVLAALQEEAGDSYKRKAYNNPDSSYNPKLMYKNPLPLPAPPLCDKPAVPLVSDDKRGVEATHDGSSPDAKAAALRAYRRALGLCYKCSEKWSKDHMCSPTVQLHAVQELWELF
jgi:hypothetical protein